MNASIAWGYFLSLSFRHSKESTLDNTKTYSVINKLTGKLLTVGGTCSGQTEMLMADNSDDDQQKWTFYPAGYVESAHCANKGIVNSDHPTCGTQMTSMGSISVS